MSHKIKHFAWFFLKQTVSTHFLDENVFLYDLNKSKIMDMAEIYCDLF